MRHYTLFLHRAGERNAHRVQFTAQSNRGALDVARHWLNKNPYHSAAVYSGQHLSFGAHNRPHLVGFAPAQHARWKH